MESQMDCSLMCVPMLELSRIAILETLIGQIWGKVSN